MILTLFFFTSGILAGAIISYFIWNGAIVAQRKEIEDLARGAMKLAMDNLALRYALHKHTSSLSEEIDSADWWKKL